MGEVGRELFASDLEWDLIQRVARDYGKLPLGAIFAVLRREILSALDSASLTLR